MEENIPPTIRHKYNLFSPNKQIPLCRPTSPNKKQKMEIKLVFHHPNLLFLNSKKVRSRDEASREVGDKLMRNIKARSKHITKSNANLRPSTSYQSQKQRGTPIRSSASNTPHLRRSHTEQTLQICGKSSCLTNQFIRNPTPNFSQNKNNTTSSSFFPQHRHHNDQNVFRFMQGKEGQMKKDAWGELIHQKANRHAVRLNMYFTVEKKYLKYVSRCR